MRVLLDTHIAIWAINNDDRLSRIARSILLDPNTDVSVSAASIWEIAIKHAIKGKRKGAIPFSGSSALDVFERAGYDMLAVTPEQTAAVDALEHLHGDPFDRLLVTQARMLDMQFLTHDKKLQDYGEFVLVI